MKRNRALQDNAQSTHSKATLKDTVPTSSIHYLFLHHPHRVTSVCGHVYNRDFPLAYSDRSRDALCLFDAPTVRKVDKSSKAVANHL